MIKKCSVVITILMILVLVIDTKTALNGVSEGIDLCIKSVIPALFPMSFLINYISKDITKIQSSFLSKICKKCGIPIGLEPLFLLSLICGYPVGSQMIMSLYKDDVIDRKSAHRLMGIFNTAGPAFIFGLSPSLFSCPYTAWIIWLIQVASSVLVAIILPSNTITVSHQNNYKRHTPSNILNTSMRSISLVCGWVVLFRVFTAYLKNKILFRFSPNVYVPLLGVIELTNGALELVRIPNEAMRFLIFGVLLSFGGICVWMQILSTVRGLGAGMFYIGKLLHIVLCGFFSLVLQLLIYNSTKILFSLISTVALFVIIVVITISVRKKYVAI